MHLAVDRATDEGRSRRSFRLHVPSDYDSAVPSSLVLVFHGHGGNPAGMERASGWSTYADRHQMIAVYPQGLPFGPGGTAFWASAGPVDFGIDDLAYVRKMLNNVQRHVCVDARRVYATGMSSGGAMAGYLACRLSGRIAAVAPIAGNHYELTKVGCDPRRPAALLEVHGTHDSVVPYDGIPDPVWPLPSIPRWLGYWRTHDRCPSRAEIFLRRHELVAMRWAPCADATAVELYRTDGGHVMPSRLRPSSTPAVLSAFFAQHPLPAPKGRT